VNGVKTVSLGRSRFGGIWRGLSHSSVFRAFVLLQREQVSTSTLVETNMGL